MTIIDPLTRKPASIMDDAAARKLPDPDRVYPAGKVVRVGAVRYAIVGTELCRLDKPLTGEERIYALRTIASGLVPVSKAAGKAAEGAAETVEEPDATQDAPEPADAAEAILGGRTAHEEAAQARADAVYDQETRA